LFSEFFPDPHSDKNDRQRPDGRLKPELDPPMVDTRENPVWLPPKHKRQKCRAECCSESSSWGSLLRVRRIAGKSRVSDHGWWLVLQFSFPDRFVGERAGKGYERERTVQYLSYESAELSFLPSGKFSERELSDSFVLVSPIWFGRIRWNWKPLPARCWVDWRYGLQFRIGFERFSAVTMIAMSGTEDGFALVGLMQPQSKIFHDAEDSCSKRTSVTCHTQIGNIKQNIHEAQPICRQLIIYK